MRIAFLWRELNGYLNACLRELASRPGVELFVAHVSPGPENPFTLSQFAWIPHQLLWSSPEELASLPSQLEAFQPDLIVLVGWTIPAYRKAVSQWKSRAARIVCMDTTWHGTLKQWLGVLSAPFFVRRLGDATWVPGVRQVQFARKLGFHPDQILQGLYSCDFDAFASAYNARLQTPPSTPSFLFVGRMVPVKGIATLAEAYKRYRLRCSAPWPLLCVGEGPLSGLLKGQPGITVEGFLQPHQLPEVMARSSCLVLPSTFEPWAVVVHEAAAAGLPILASNEVGAVPHLVHEGENGFLFDSDDVGRLAELMERISTMPSAELTQMAARSHQLAQAFTPRRWADTLLDFYSKSGKSHSR